MFERRLPTVIVGLLSVAIVVAVPAVTGGGHYFALATLPPAVGVVVAIHQLRRQFGVPAFAVSIRSSPNRWNGVAGGTIAFVNSLILQRWLQPMEAARVPSACLLAATLLVFVWLTIYGAALKDVADEAVEVDTETA
ncbi:hypothetical protein [Halobaculum sp. MBLA0143]|uniref:hypothetical protein n=1 Tax=Halobaculum sp. MBLA0143 TaxID=3079933 RepID=UPI00352503A1